MLRNANGALDAVHVDGEDAQPVHAGRLIRCGGQDLEADAYTERAPVGADAVDDRFVKLVPAKLLHGSAKGANAGDDHVRRAPHD